MKVHVVAWAYNSGGGFDWYRTAAAAEKAYEVELRNEKDPTLAREGWKAYRFDYEVTSDKTATEEIDWDLIENCEQAAAAMAEGRVAYLGGEN